MAPLLVAGVVVGVIVAALIALAVARAVFGRPRGSRRRARKWTSAGGLVIDGRGRIALVRQRNRRGRWRWTLPKGRIDRGETAEAAALREVYEESGLRAKILRPIVLHEGRLHFTHYFEMTLERDDARQHRDNDRDNDRDQDRDNERETKEVRLATFAEAADLLRSRRDLRVLRRLVEMRTGVVSRAS